MNPPFSGALGVLRVQVAPELYLAAEPRPIAVALTHGEELAADIERIGDAPTLVPVELDGALAYCWIRARDVLTVDVVPTEDPSTS